MQDFVTWLIKQIVEKPEEVVVEEKEENNQILLSLHVASVDMGRVIGKEGKVIKAIRNLLKVKAIKENRLVNLQLIEAEQV